MSIKLIICLLSISVLYSCQRPKEIEEEVEEEGGCAMCLPDTRNDAIELNPASVPEDLVDEDQFKFKIIASELGDYLFRGTEMCNQRLASGQRIFMDSDTLEKYGTGVPFQTVWGKDEDSILFSFKIIHDCCLTAIPILYEENDSLRIFGDVDGLGCDCYCDYLYEYKLPSSKYEKYKNIE